MEIRRHCLGAKPIPLSSYLGLESGDVMAENIFDRLDDLSTIHVRLAVARRPSGMSR